MDKKLEIQHTCIKCDSCAIICPEQAVHFDGNDFSIDPFACTLCQICIQVCPVDCIKEKNYIKPTVNNNSES